MKNSLSWEKSQTYRAVIHVTAIKFKALLNYSFPIRKHFVTLFNNLIPLNTIVIQTTNRKVCFYLMVIYWTGLWF
jgi:hypothetical protein